MEGKKNIVFGFVYLIFTASLGLVMVGMTQQVEDAAATKQDKVSQLEQGLQSGFMMGGDPVEVASDALLAMNSYMNAQQPIDSIKGSPHAHGNLESLINIAVGILLLFLAIPVWFKQLISWVFIIATLFHSGMLYLSNPYILGWGWAGTLLNTGIGPFGLLIGFGLMAVAVFIGLKPERQA
ncbi:MAG TPA: hypothetical protein VKA55_02540 [Gammaproteobacteria bacterium]|nr:hypothetical protein [Gammaproteobacteria bacterium]